MYIDYNPAPASLATRQDYLKHLQLSAFGSAESYLGGSTFALKYVEEQRPRVGKGQWFRLDNPTGATVNNDRLWKPIKLTDLTTAELRLKILESPDKKALSDLQESEYTPYPTDLQIPREKLETLASLLATGEYIALVHFPNAYTLDVTSLHYNQIYGYWYFVCGNSGNRRESLRNYNTLEHIRLYKKVNF